MTRIFIVLSGVLGFSAVVLGAFGAHGMRSRLESLPDGMKRLEWWNTAAHYHLTHALAGWSFVAGVVLFSGSLYLMAVTGQTKLGAITPIGGVFFLVGWGAVIVAGWRLSAVH
ncbi:MAG: DUF423 domain-containing protein [Deltaproteobacteria bacterium]|nr:DUF423 domain-containing protein [Deltaproteobacteria bacterium]